MHADFAFIDEDCAAFPVAEVLAVDRATRQKSTQSTTHVIPRSWPYRILCLRRSIPSSPVPLPSKPAHFPTPLVFQSILAASAHLRATSGFPISYLPSKFWHCTNSHQLGQGAYFLVQSCWTFPAHSTGPCLHQTPKSGSESSILCITPLVSDTRDMGALNGFTWQRRRATDPLCPQWI